MTNYSWMGAATQRRNGRLPSRRGWWKGALALLLAGAAFAANAAIVCVGPSATGSGSGADWSNVKAWSGTPARGDTWYLKGGSYGGKTFSVAASGSSLITVKKATVADHGPSTGWQDSFGTAQATFSSAIQFTSPYWVFDGQTGGGPGSWKTGFGFKVTETSSNPVIFCNGAGNINVRHVELQGAGNNGAPGGTGNDGLQTFQGSGPVTVSYAFIHDLGRCIFYFGGGGAMTAEYVYSGGYESVDAEHSELVVIRSSALFTFRWGVIAHEEGTGGFIGAEQNSTAEIYGNIFYNSSEYGSWATGNNGLMAGFTSSHLRNWRVYNNTFINLPSGLTSFYGGGDPQGCVAANNYWYNSPNHSASDWGSQSYDHFQSSGSASGSSGTSGSGNPFVTLDSSSRDFGRLIAGTTAGTALSAPYNVDMWGNTRSTWTRGAIEFGGTASPVASLSSGTVNCGSIAVGASGTQTVTIKNAGSGTLSGTATVAAPFSIVSGGTYSLGASQSQVVTLGFNPTAAGTFNQTVTFTGGGGATCQVTGTATAPSNPVISISPGSQSFGSVSVGSTADRTFTVQNTGTGTLTGSATTVAPFSIVSGGSYNLGAGQSQTVTVRYSPTAAGNNSQTVSFTGASGSSASVSGTATVANRAPVVSAISQNATDVDPGTAGLQVYAGTVVQYTGSASDPDGNPLTWKWIYTINGGSEITVQSGSGVVTPVSFSYTTNMSGSTCVWKLRVSDGITTSESTLTVGVMAPPQSTGSLTFSAIAGTITAPFVVSNGAISQASTTGVTDGGRAVYSFTITTTGKYAIMATVNAPTLTGNSFYLNIDAEPQDPAMAWDINPVTAGFEQRLVSWRGNGTPEGNQYVPQIFTLTAGSHQLIIRGREANTFLQRLSILQVPPAPENLRVVGMQ